MLNINLDVMAQNTGSSGIGIKLTSNIGCSGDNNKLKMYYKRAPVYQYYGDVAASNYYTTTPLPHNMMFRNIRIIPIINSYITYTYEYQSSPFAVSVSQEANMVALIHYESIPNFSFPIKHFYTINPSAENLDGFIRKEIVGYVYPLDYKNINEVKDIVRVHRYYSPSIMNHYYQTGETTPPDYSAERNMDFYAFDVLSKEEVSEVGSEIIPCFNAVAVNMFEGNDLDLYYSKQTNPPNGYTPRGVAWYASTEEMKGMVPLYRRYVGRHHYYSLIKEPDSETDPICYVYQNKPAEMGCLRPIYRHTLTRGSLDVFIFSPEDNGTSPIFYAPLKTYEISDQSRDKYKGPTIESNSVSEYTLNIKHLNIEEKVTLKTVTKPLSEFGIKVSSTSVCKGSPVTLSILRPKPGATYSWETPEKVFNGLTVTDYPSSSTQYILIERYDRDKEAKSILIEVVNTDDADRISSGSKAQFLQKSLFTDNAQLKIDNRTPSELSNRSYSYQLQLSYPAQLTDVETKADWPDYTLRFQTEFFDANKISLGPPEVATLKLSWIKGSTSIYDALKVYNSSIASKAPYVTVTLLKPPSTTAIPADVKLVLESKDYFLNLPIISQTSLFYNPTTSKVSWEAMEGVSSYDLEYVYIDEFDRDENDGVLNLASDASAPFQYKKAVRINTPHTEFDFHNTYHKGVVYFRVRGVRCQCKGNGTWKGIWSYGDNTAPRCQLVINAANQFEAKKNWQVVTNYSEDGKFKKVVSFADGSLRNRQTLTNLSSESVVIAGETKYDYEGRPVINVMPVPLKTSALSYQNNLNSFVQETNVGTEKLAYDNYVASAPLKNTSGASKYYSANNDFEKQSLSDAPADMFRDYLPESFGYAYSQTVYTGDNTGRISKQSMPGLDFKINYSSKEPTHFTRHYYATPNETELRKLFGSNVGEAKKYVKQAVMDPNGQISVSYIDQAGKTIATALSGGSPSNLVALEPKQPSDMVVSLNGNNEFDPITRSFKSLNKILNVTPAQSYTFKYDFTGVINTINSPPFTGFCKECSYELAFKIYSPDGLVIADFVEPLTAPTGTNCTSAGSFTKSMDGKIFNFDEVGEYTVSKELRLTGGGIEAALEKLRTTSTFYPKEKDYQTKYINLIDPSKCDITCEDKCKSQARKDGILESDPNYQNKLNEYKMKLCDGLVSEVIDAISDNECENTMQLMLRQVSPGGYFNNDAWLQKALDDNSIVFNDEKGVPLATKPTLLELKNKDLFKSEWAKAMVKRHPEHCHYTNCIVDIPSTKYDRNASVIKYLSDAKSQGYYDPLDLPEVENTVILLDPFFSEGRGKAYFSEMRSKLLNYTNAGSGNMSIWQFAKSNFPYDNKPPGIIIKGAQEIDQEWNLLRGLYKGLKEEIKSSIPGCPYLDVFDENTIAIEAKSSGSNGVVESELNMLSHCLKLCPEKVSLWMTKLEDKDSQVLTDATKRTKIKTALTSYCNKKCGVNNIMALISDEEINKALQGLASADPDLVAVTNELSPSGKLALKNIGSSISCTNSSTQTTDGINPLARAYLNLYSNIIQTIAKDCGTPNSNCLTTTERLVFDPMKFDYYRNNREIFGPMAEISVILKYHREPLNTGQIVYDGIVFSLGKYYENKIVELDFANIIPNVISDLNTIKGFANLRKTSIMIAPRRYESGYVNFNNCYELDIITYNAPPKLHPNFTYGKTYDEQITDPQILKGLHFVENDGRIFQMIGGIKICDELVSRNVEVCMDPVINLGKLPEGLDPIAQERARCLAAQRQDAFAMAKLEWMEWVEKFESDFLSLHYDQCLQNPFTEDFYYSTQSNNELQYTLYYYDQAGNLVKTVPPAGENSLTPLAFEPNGTYKGVKDVDTHQPEHHLETRYKYNSLNQLIWQKTPEGKNKVGDALVDGNITRFFYNEKGQLRLSQNSKQQAASTLNNNIYSYTKYDPQGRILTVGEVKNLPEDFSFFETTTTNAQYKAVMAKLNIPDYPGTSSELIATCYDSPLSNQASIEQHHVRNRVVAKIKYNIQGLPISSTFYSYDIHGNVDVVEQNIAGFPSKIINYDYDLLSGKVNKVSYQTGKDDAYYHQYEYDADNRLTKVFTSLDNHIWNQDARYFYYKHGPLARIELGQYKVQGLDYFYTLQGWLKGINTPATRVANTKGKYQVATDPGADGIANNVNGFLGQDHFAYGLGYYKGDYTPIKPEINLGAVSDNNYTTGQMADAIRGTGLYNGNITYTVGQVNGLSDLIEARKNDALEDKEKFSMRGMAYQYDQLNRLVKGSSYTNFTTGWGTRASGYNSAAYDVTYAYDKNGNITTAKVNGNSAALMDNLEYNYPKKSNGFLVNNQLAHVTDAAGKTSGEDLATQAADNYSYDAIGNLEKDVSEGITHIEWDVYGKITRVEKNNALKLAFVYDCDGNRIAKKIYNGGSLAKTTFYVRDASGTVMATYDEVGADIAVEHNIYGSSRLGVEVRNMVPNVGTIFRLVGNKSYEIANHLGNVMAIVSDQRLGQDLGTDKLADFYNPILKGGFDYYPFGMTMASRSGSVGGYKYGFNGKEKDNDGLGGGGSTYDYGFRIYNPALGKFLSVDPLTGKFPMLTPYQFASNTPIWAVDLDGLEARVYTDLSAIPHSFITVIDDKGVLNLYTFGQYGQKGKGLGGLYNTGSSLVHLKGDDANAYMKHEFENYPMGVYELSKETIDKDKVIEYYAKEMEQYTIPAKKVGEHAPTFANEKNGSKAVKYKPYYLTPSGCDNENCSSVVNDGLEAGGIDFYVPAVPWLFNESLWEQSIINENNVTDVTSDAKKGANENRNGSQKNTSVIKPAVKPKVKSK